TVGKSEGGAIHLNMGAGARQTKNIGNPRYPRDIIRRIIGMGRNTMRRITFLSVVALFSAAALLAEDSWVKKEYMQWTDEEVKKVLTDSAWAKDVTVNAPMSALGRGQRPAAASGTDSETTGGGGGR